MLRYCTLGLLFTALFTSVARADEGGISFWLPGQFGSLAAAPAQPGWSAASIYYHTTVNAGGDVAAARQFTVGRYAQPSIPTVDQTLTAVARKHEGPDMPR